MFLDCATGVEIKSVSSKSISKDEQKGMKMKETARNDLWYLSLEEVCTTEDQVDRYQQNQERPLRQVVFTQKKLLTQERVSGSGEYGGNCLLPAQLVLREYFHRHDSHPKSLHHDLLCNGYQESCAGNSNKCDQNFSQNFHLIQYTEDNACKCLDQNNSLSHDSSLVISKVIHREKPYECKECGKFFSCKSNLIVHQKTHKVEAMGIQ